MARVADICGKIIWAAVGLYAVFLPWGVTGSQIALGIGVLAWIVKSAVEGRIRWRSVLLLWVPLALVPVLVRVVAKRIELGAEWRLALSTTDLVSIYVIGLALLFAVELCLSGRRGDGRRDPLGWPVLAFVLAFLLGSVVGWVVSEAVRELLSLRTLLAVFLVATTLRDRVGLRRVALVLVGSLALLSLYAGSARLVMVAKRKAMHVPLVVSRTQVERLEREGRAEGEGFWLPDLGSMSEAGQLAIGLPIALALLLAERNRKLRIALIVALVLLGANLILNMKRGAWIAFLAALLVFALVEKRRVVLVVLLLFVVAGALVPAARNRVFQTVAGDDGHRLELWCTVPKVLRDYPFGIGPGCSYHVLRTSRYVPPPVYYAMPDKVHFHSTFAELAVGAGPLALGAFVWWFVAFGVWCIRRLRRMQSDAAARPIVLAGLLAAVAFFVNGLFEYNLGDSDVTLMVYLAMGIAMAAAPTSIEEEKQKVHEDETESREENDDEG